ncbi:MAG: rRNA maturation RNase YbeY, partial [Elusimicrobia bacterium]|nr:rRNA maturation RNase YbeY [Elusimicrobiota bacterium]
MRRINRDYLGHDYDTDVIAFPYGGGRADDAPFGDVFVSVDQAKAQAKELGHSLLTEALTLAVHGTLHLAGYRDGRPADRRRMFARQDRLVRRFLGAPKGSWGQDAGG